MCKTKIKEMLKTNQKCLDVGKYKKVCGLYLLELVVPKCTRTNDVAVKTHCETR